MIDGTCQGANTGSSSGSGLPGVISYPDEPTIDDGTGVIVVEEPAPTGTLFPGGLNR
jgi:hypothetical protein